MIYKEGKRGESVGGKFALAEIFNVEELISDGLLILFMEQMYLTRFRYPEQSIANTKYICGLRWLARRVRKMRLF